MGDNELWEDDPKGYDGWLEPHKIDDEGERAIACHTKSKLWWFSAKVSLITFLVNFLLFQSVRNIETERSFFSFCMIICMVIFALSASSSILWDKEFDKEMGKLYYPDADDSYE